MRAEGIEPGTRRRSGAETNGICDHKDKDAVSMALQEISDLREGRLGG